MLINNSQLTGFVGTPIYTEVKVQVSGDGPTGSLKLCAWLIFEIRQKK